MKQKVQELIQQALNQLSMGGEVSVQIDWTKNISFGDLSCNIALLLAKNWNKKPRELAQQIKDNLSPADWLERVEIAGPGFLNFFIKTSAFYSIIHDILSKQDAYGVIQDGGGKRIHLEFVSSNPTGPLHVGHGRTAAYGSSLANILSAGGYDVHKAYYVNDHGRQMNILATSLWLRYLELCGKSIILPSNGYRGEYLRDMARDFKAIHGDRMVREAADIFQGIPPDLSDDGSGDKEVHIDALIARSKALLGEDNYSVIFNHGLDAILQDMKNDLREFRVTHDEWFSERSLYESGAVDHAIKVLRDRGCLHDREGALWFQATRFGDEKDRVLIRENGEKTYFAADIAYHLHTYERGFDRIIDVLGADHHGYAPRIKASMAAMGKDADKYDALFIQFVTLYRESEKVPMSTRSGSFVTLRELRKEVGNDAARFFYIYRKRDQHLDFDLELAKSQSNANPVYYIQYAYARIASVLCQMKEKGMAWDQTESFSHLHQLSDEGSRALLIQLSRYPEVIRQACTVYEPAVLAYYLHELASDFHSYYNAYSFLVSDNVLRQARVTLIMAVAQVIKNGLTLLCVDTPQSM